MIWSVVLDLVIVALLAATIGYAISLNRKLARLRRQRAELESGFTAFQQAIKRAEDGIGDLRVSAESLQSRIDAATRVHTDLAFLIERGERTADRLEGVVRGARPAAGTPAPASRAAARGVPRTPPSGPAPHRSITPQPAAQPRSETERALLKALAEGG